MSPVTPRFGAASTAAEVADGVDLTGRRVVVTGASSGIGLETARALAGTGAAVTLAVRDVETGRRVADDIRATTGNDEIAVSELDLASLASVDGFVVGVRQYALDAASAARLWEVSLELVAASRASRGDARSG